jgi:DNA-binding GntR family transcriptional regulator
MAPFEQAAERIRDDIRRGKLKPGDKLPSHRAIAAEYEMALATAQKALRVLADEGWVVARQSIGVFVSDSPGARTEPVTLATLAQQVGELTEALSDLRDRVQRIEDGPRTD